MLIPWRIKWPSDKWTPKAVGIISGGDRIFNFFYKVIFILDLSYFLKHVSSVKTKSAWLISSFLEQYLAHGVLKKILYKWITW